VNFKNLSKGIVAVLITVLFFAQCTKIKVTDLGTDLLPAVDNVNTFDTSIEVISTNFLFGDSAVPFMGRDNSNQPSAHVLGYISNDPQFGTTNASIYLELKPPFYKYTFENVEDSLQLDSVVLCMKYINTWGDTNAVQQVNVYQVTQTLRNDTSYGTNTNVSYGQLLGTKTFAPKELNDSIFPYGQKLANQLRIRLNDELGNLFLAQDTAAGEPYNNDSLFRAFFKGFAVVPEVSGAGANANALNYFSIGDTSTHLRIYYKYTKNGVTDTAARNFTFDNNTRSGHVNKIERNYSGSEFAQFIPGNPAGDSLVFIQAAPGSYAKINIPELLAFKALKGNVMVHLAELNMSQIPEGPASLNNILTPPTTLYLDYQDTTQKKQLPFVNDAFITGTYSPLLFGGTNKPQTVNGSLNAEYKFFITRHVQGIITRNNPNFPLYLYAPFNARYPTLFIAFGVNNLANGRVKLGGGSNATRKMKLRLVYSKI
jgi:hypothetical protein